MAATDADAAKVPTTPVILDFSRKHFPDDFVFGVATSAYQVEGAFAQGGRGYSIWDVYSNGYPANVLDGSNGNEAVGMYTRYKEDIKMMKMMGFDAYRFSISWSRIIPGGKLSLGVNQEGVDYYNDLINTIIENGMKPYVTLFHWDLPYLLEKEYGGFLSSNIVDDFRDFAELCFWEFGDRVKHWITINEAWTYAVHGYANRWFPPGNGYFGPDTDAKKRADAADVEAETLTIDTKINPRVKSVATDVAFAALSTDLEAGSDAAADVEPLFTDFGQSFVPYRGVQVAREATVIVPNIMMRRLSSPGETNDLDEEKGVYVLRELAVPHKSNDCEKAKEAYTVARNLLLSHGVAVQSYRKRFQGLQKGKIGMTNNIHWFEPFNDTEEDKLAAKRAFDFMLGWFLEPVLTGQYPENMLNYAKQHITPFTEDESKLLKGSSDFLGINHYTTWYATNDHNPSSVDGYNRDQMVRFLYVKNNKPIGESTGSSWLYIVPWGFYKLLKFLNQEFNKDGNLPPIYITENGCDQQNDPTITPFQACKDEQRVKYFHDYLSYLSKAINEDNIKVESYFAWSFCDNFEWYDGYRSRFGILFIDFKNDLKRYRKDSAMWFTKFLLK